VHVIGLGGICKVWYITRHILCVVNHVHDVDLSGALFVVASGDISSAYMHVSCTMIFNHFLAQEQHMFSASSDAPLEIFSDVM
jgi:hypothetical protein